MGIQLEKQEYSTEYICTHLGEENAASINYGAVVPPIYATSLHVFETMHELLDFDAQKPQGQYIYGRVDNPTVCLLERKLAALEKADGALCFSSGMAAITAAILHCVKPGSHAVTVENVYGPARLFFESYLQKFGVEVTFVSGMDTEEFAQAVRPNTTLFYLESPTSAVFELQDLQSVAAIARQHGIKTVVDNTWATPVYQQPLTLGIDITLHTMSKYIGGHSDLIGGVLCAREEIIREIKRSERELIGGILGPFEAWLALRGLRTMPAKLAASGRNAMAVAQLLEASPRVRRVNYPGLASHRQYALAKKQMSGSSGLLSFELNAAADEAVAFADKLQLFRKGVSWGGFESLVCMPMYKYSDEEARRHNSVRGLIRLYCGIENTDDLLADIQAALQ